MFEDDPLGGFYGNKPEEVPSTVETEASVQDNATKPVNNNHVAPPPGNEFSQRKPMKQIPLFISKFYLPADNNNVTYNVQNLLRQLGVSEDYEIILYSDFYKDEQRLTRIQDLLTAANISCTVSYEQYRPNKDRPSSSHAIICLWNGFDDFVPRVIDSYRFLKIPVAWKMVDPKLTSMWSHANNVDAVVVATNGGFKEYKTKTFAICGVGSALQAKTIIPTFPEILGSKLKQFGNQVFKVCRHENTDIIAFPTKHGEIVVKEDKSNIPEWAKSKCSVGEKLPGYRGLSDKELIDKGFTQLAKLIEQYSYKSVLIPMVGCGSGGLNWNEDIVPIIRSNEAIRPHLTKLYVAQMGKGRIPLLETIP